MAAIISFVEAHTTPLLLFVSLVTLVNHLRRKNQVTYIEVFVNSGAAGMALVALVGTSVSEKRTGLSFGEFAAMLTAYGVWLFVLICDVLRRVGAFLLTYWRGEKWVREIDYIYLTLGALGVASTANKLDFLTDRLSFGDAIGPIVLTTALVLRFIKTRAEIAGWNKATGET